ncbi:MAG TPA: NADH-quinone oxidoreductase subunit N [Actinobacteria bacterium]|nr:NADH-quinone oxidoreductase subunit N [Actinomycetota bacterium]
MNRADLVAVLPEVILLAGALAVVTLAVFADRPRAEWGTAAGLALFLAGVAAGVQWWALGDTPGSLHFSARGLEVLRNPMVVMDPYSALAGIAICVVGLLGLLAAWELVGSLGRRGPEFVALLLLAVAGLHAMTIAANLVLLFLALETASISFYVMAGFTRERLDADEAALKYFLLGSFASAIFVYGVALLFAATGALGIYGAGGLRSFFATTIVVEPGVLVVALGMLLVGFGFKVSAAPFHQWAPDVYQGAPSGAVGLMAAGVKLAGFLALGRVFAAGLPAQIDRWSSAVAILAGVSVIVGSVLAAVQRDVKRLLAYSGVAHAGYVLVGLTVGVFGLPAVTFYATTYAVMLMGAFALVGAVSGSGGGASPFEDWAGLGRRAPGLALAMTALLLGLGGLPFTAGFVGKLQVFTAAIRGGFLWLVVLALVTTVVGLYFYLRVVATMYFDDGEGAVAATPWTTRVVVGVAVVVTLALGIFPWPYLDVVRDALPL